MIYYYKVSKYLFNQNLIRLTSIYIHMQHRITVFMLKLQLYARCVIYLKLQIIQSNLK